MIEALRAAVLDREKPDNVCELYRSLKQDSESPARCPNRKRHIVCVTEFRTKEGKIDQLIDAMHALMQARHKEPFRIRHELKRRLEDRWWISIRRQTVKQKERRRALRNVLHHPILAL